MTVDHDDANESESAADSVPRRPLAAQLLELQSIDTSTDQLRAERQRSPLREDLAARSAQLQAWEQRRVQLRARLDELAATIDRAEAKGGELSAHRDRLERQLKTVFAAREAEALMHEISTIDGQRDDLDLHELEAMEEQSTLDDDLATHLSAHEAMADAVRMADDALDAAIVGIDAELTALGARRAQLIDDVADELLGMYERSRKAHGVAIAELQGKQCLGCHLDLSAAEIDTAKESAAETGITECPQCGRMLVV